MRENRSGEIGDREQRIHRCRDGAEHCLTWGGLSVQVCDR